MKVKSIRYAGKMDVYNMEVDDTHDFVVQGGVISHNCSDEWRYMCMARPIKPTVPEEAPIIRAVNRVLFGNERPMQAVEDLMLRDSRIENSGLEW